MLQAVLTHARSSGSRSSLLQTQSRSVNDSQNFGTMVNKHVAYARLVYGLDGLLDTYNGPSISEA
jgi:hypothetical protein